MIWWLLREVGYTVCVYNWKAYYIYGIYLISVWIYAPYDSFGTTEPADGTIQFYVTHLRGDSRAKDD